jgi:hypothetical protein
MKKPLFALLYLHTFTHAGNQSTFSQEQLKADLKILGDVKKTLDTRDAQITQFNKAKQEQARLITQARQQAQQALDILNEIK